MANLLETAELVWRQINPNPNDETAISREEVIAASKLKYAYYMWRKSKEEKAQEGEFNVPSYLLSEKEMDVVNNEIDISKLEVLKSLDNDGWLVNVGGLGCVCDYVKTNVNMAQLMCDDDSVGEGARTYLVLGNKIKFPKGVHKSPLPLIYANMGEKVEDEIEIDDAIADAIREALLASYLGKIGREDVTNNTNSNESNPA